MTISFDKALKQVLLSVDTGYRAHGIDTVLDTPPEDQTELQRSVVMTLSREHQTLDIRIIDWRNCLNHLVYSKWQIQMSQFSTSRHFAWDLDFIWRALFLIE